jgi:hypothetical protein
MASASVMLERAPRASKVLIIRMCALFQYCIVLDYSFSFLSVGPQVPEEWMGWHRGLELRRRHRYAKSAEECDNRCCTLKLSISGSNYLHYYVPNFDLFINFPSGMEYALLLIYCCLVSRPEF